MPCGVGGGVPTGAGFQERVGEGVGVQRRGRVGAWLAVQGRVGLAVRGCKGFGCGGVGVGGRGTGPRDGANFASVVGLVDGGGRPRALIPGEGVREGLAGGEIKGWGGVQGLRFRGGKW